MTDEHLRLQQEQDKSHEETLKLLGETNQVLAHVQTVLSEAQIRLQIATQKYEERLYGPKVPRHY